MSALCMCLKFQLFLNKENLHTKKFYIFIRYLFFTPCVACWLEWLHSQHLMSTGRQGFCYKVNWVTDKNLAHKEIIYFIVDKG